MANMALVGVTGNIGIEIPTRLSRADIADWNDPRRGRSAAPEVSRLATVLPAVAAALAGVLRGRDVVIVSLKWNINDIDAVIEAIQISKVRRADRRQRRQPAAADGRLHFDH